MKRLLHYPVAPCHPSCVVHVDPSGTLRDCAHICAGCLNVTSRGAPSYEGYHGKLRSPPPLAVPASISTFDLFTKMYLFVLNLL